MTTLKSCPLCGGTPHDDSWQIKCQNCGLRVGSDAELWNTRPAEDERDAIWCAWMASERVANRAQANVSALRKALQALVDVPHSAQLIGHADEWKQAMEMAHDVLESTGMEGE